MIKSLQITNFQSHEKTELEFSPRVNIIVGSSDCGKTAIIRALRWLIWNRPSGDSIRSSWGGETRAQLELQENIIIRSKDKVDKYILEEDNIRNGNKHNKTEFKAFGTSVPEEISRFLNINEINLQNQLDAPFLLSESPGAVASHFNKVARLDKIDTSTQNVQSWINQLSFTIGKEAVKDKPATGLIKQIEDKEQELKQFDHLEKFEIDVEVLEGMDKKLLNLRSNHTKLCLIYNSYLVNAEQILCFQDDLKLEKPLNQIFEWKYEIEDIGTEGSELNFLVKQIKDVQAKISEQEELITLEKPVNVLLELYENKETADDQRKRLFKAVREINNVKSQLTNSEASYTALYAKFNKEMGTKCILCGSKLN